MKRKLLSLMLACLMLTGCGGSSSSTGSESGQGSSAVQISSKETDNKNTASVQAADFMDVMPVLSIQTESDDKNVLDFVKKPVAEHVTKSRASWDHGFKAPVPYYEPCSVSLFDTDGKTLIDSVSAQVKVRGNWTTMYNKKPLRIKFDEKQSMLDLCGGAEFKNWLLLAEYKDGSMLRNKAALAAANEILGEDGLYASDAEFVEVTINGEYFGVYLLCEYAQINKNRIDITKPEEGYEGTDIGYYLEYDGYYYTEDELHSFKTYYNTDAPLTPYDGNGGSNRTGTPLAGGKNNVGFSIKSDIYSKAQHDFIYHFVDNVYNIMYYAAYENKAYAFDENFSEIHEVSDMTPQEAVERVVDVNSLADMYIISELTCDADIYWSSFFMYADFGEGGSKRLTFGNPWDFDSGLGNKDRCASGEGYYAANIVPDVNGNYRSINPWLAVLMYCDWYTDIIRDKWTSAYDGGVFTRMIDMVRGDTKTYAPAFERNYDKWDNIRHNEAGNELCPAAAACKTQEECAEYLALWLEGRVTFMNECWHK